MVVYLDGVPVAYNQGLPQQGSVLNGGASFIGALVTNAMQAVFSGIIDYVRVYNAALSTGAISNLVQGANVTGELEGNVASDWTGAPWLVVPSTMMISTNDDSDTSTNNSPVTREFARPPPAPQTSCILQIVQ
jgi:hypothetical protein